MRLSSSLFRSSSNWIRRSYYNSTISKNNNLWMTRRMEARAGTSVSMRRMSSIISNSHNNKTPSCWKPRKLQNSVARYFSSSDDSNPLLEEPRESMAFDVLIVGGGPSGLSASIRLKQLNPDLSVCVIDKGSEIGAHILSGNVFDPKALEELLPNLKDSWMDEFQASQGAHATAVQQDEFQVLTETSSYTIPNILLPSQLHNDGNYILSLSQLCRWLATQAEELGVEVYPGFAASEVLLEQGGGGGVKGIATRDVGLAKDGTPKSTFERGMELHATQTLFAEGARGSCSEFLMEHFDLRKDAMPQTYGLGIKEVWEVPEENLQPGLVQHTLGWPLQTSPTSDVFGGSFLYHLEPNLILVGLVVGLDYANPYLNPYQEFQRWKTHPSIKKQLEGGTCISYGARVLNEGGFHAIPKLTFPGGALIGCSAGFLNAVKIKGTHTAIKSGMLAAEAIVEEMTSDANLIAETGELPEDHVPKEVTSFTTKLESSWVHDELYQVRNCHQAFAKWGVGAGLAYSGLAAHITKGKEPWTLDHTTPDSKATKPSADFEPIDYPPPDSKLTFDLLTNLQRSGTYHAEDQPAHLRIKPELEEFVDESISHKEYAAPEQRFCPAAVYEYVDDSENDDNKKLVINAQNCVHCKCCSIKMPEEYIDWTVPEGGGGPQYQVM